MKSEQSYSLTQANRFLELRSSGEDLQRQSA